MCAFEVNDSVELRKQRERSHLPLWDSPATLYPSSKTCFTEFKWALAPDTYSPDSPWWWTSHPTQHVWKPLKGSVAKSRTRIKVFNTCQPFGNIPSLHLSLDPAEAWAAILPQVTNKRMSLVEFYPTPLVLLVEHVLVLEETMTMDAGWSSLDWYVDTHWRSQLRWWIEHLYAARAP